MEIAVTKTHIKTKNGQAFPKLTRDDAAALQDTITGDSRFVTLAELYQYAQSSEGARQTLLLSLRRDNPQATMQDVAKIGSPMEIAQLGQALLAEFLTADPVKE